MKEATRLAHTRRSFLRRASALACSWPLAAAPSVDPDPETVRRVHLVFKTHLDIGYTDLARTVLRRYLDEFIPRALEIAEATRRKNPRRRFRWTTGSWLIDQALKQADPRHRDRLEDAIRRGDILWHALPFTLESEGSTASLVAQATAIARRLDARFGRSTIAAKMTDVPGHTRSLVPHLARQGVRFLHIGVNPASSAPEVPSFCRWRAPDGSEILLQYHKEYYGGEMALPGGEVVTAVMMTNDNHGPETPEAVEGIFEKLAKRYPRAEVLASTLDEIAREVIAIRSGLPVVTGEMGDTWIHGFASDPWKMSRMRRLSRLRDEWLAAGDWQAGSAADLAFASPLLMVAEHTWGMNSARTGHGEIQRPADLACARKELPSFLEPEESWRELLESDSAVATRRSRVGRRGALPGAILLPDLRSRALRTLRAAVRNQHARLGLQGSLQGRTPASGGTGCGLPSDPRGHLDTTGPPGAPGARATTSTPPPRQRSSWSGPSLPEPSLPCQPPSPRPAQQGTRATRSHTWGREPEAEEPAGRAATSAGMSRNSPPRLMATTTGIHRNQIAVDTCASASRSRRDPRRARGSPPRSGDASEPDPASGRGSPRERPVHGGTPRIGRASRSGGRMETRCPRTPRSRCRGDAQGGTILREDRSGEVNPE